ncbi:DNA cytosine methyltransferase [Neisseria musculi]|uniref:C-5 cytosine-specific DNA methylase family protein n=1 Tax=Neisseria musculi TaxID=1815583 RepID=A0ACD0ZJ41_9NEIS|nr:DNA cytosine methyltransferase [Neisseria musculi]
MKQHNLSVLHTGDCRQILPELAAQGIQVQTCITSPQPMAVLVRANWRTEPAKMAGTGSDITALMGTVTANGSQHRRPSVNRALKVAAFLINYYGNGDARDLTAPPETLTTKDRLALVTVYINRQPYYIVDITLRMLLPKELYKAQGFPEDYIFDRDHTGKPLTKTAQVRMCGNSVSPPPMAALIRENYRPEAVFAGQQAA